MQQRGLAATQGIIEALLDGVELQQKKPADRGNIMVVDIMPNRRAQHSRVNLVQVQ